MNRAASSASIPPALPGPEVGALEATDPHAIGRYRLLGRLGAGGMGVVYLVDDPGGARFALKALSGSHRMEAELRARLAREARSLTSIDSPHVVRVVDVDTAAEVPYLVMTYAEGVGLDRAIPEHGLSTSAVLEYGTQLAGAVAHVHQRGIIHRDLKPHNVILGHTGVTLVDFGIASLDDEGTTALTRKGTFLGSLAWLAPEVIAGAPADYPSDAFGLGLVLGFMALGRNPFGAGRPEAVMYRIMHGEPDLAGCDPGLVAIIASALVKDPAARASAAEIRSALQARLDGQVQSGKSPGVFKVRVGDCVRDPMAHDDTVVPCSDPHRGEVVLVDHSFYAAESAAPPSIDIDGRTAEASMAAVENYTGQPFEESVHGYIVRTPTADSWAYGDRLLVVYLTTMDRSLENILETTGSAASPPVRPGKR